MNIPMDLSDNTFPKGTDFTKLTHSEVASVEKKLNSRPRKILNFKTPSEMFFELNKFSSGDAFHTWKGQLINSKFLHLNKVYEYMW